MSIWLLEQCSQIFACRPTHSWSARKVSEHMLSVEAVLCADESMDFTAAFKGLDGQGRLRLSPHWLLTEHTAGRLGMIQKMTDEMDEIYDLCEICKTWVVPQIARERMYEEWLGGRSYNPVSLTGLSQIKGGKYVEDMFNHH